MKTGILILSDKGFSGERTDSGGPLLARWLGDRGAEIIRTGILPDEALRIEATLKEWADKGDLDLIITSGGTGLSPRDITPEATRRVLDREIPGLAEEMRRSSSSITPNALLSRSVVGTRKETLIINLPGSPKGAVENLSAIWPAIPHAVAKIKGDPADCAEPVDKKDPDTHPKGQHNA